MISPADMLARLGFNAEFDATAPQTRGKRTERLGFSVAVLVVSAAAIGVERAFAWWIFSLTAEAWLWASTDPDAYEEKPVTTRLHRFLASGMSSLSWVFIGLLYWFDGHESSRLLTVTLLAGILLYVVSTCYRNILHLLVCALPPALCILLLPFSYRGSTLQLAMLEGAMLLLLGFVGSSAIAANRANRNLLATTRELMEKREIAETASRTKSEFLANMSHEIRTPLNGVMGIAGALAHTRLTDSQRDMVGLIETSARNLEILVSDILDLTRIESGRAEVAAEPFEPLAEVRVCAELFKATLAAKGLEFHLFPDEAARRPVLGDAARLRQIVCNLMSNAAKFTEEGSVTMRIGAQAVGERVRLTCEVEDTGIGFDAATKSRLFERFEQADGSITRRYGGSGLGLAISRSLAEAMGGSLTAESEPGEGSRFTLTLEVQAAPADAVVAPPVVAERPRAPAAPAQAEEAAPEVDAAPAMPEAGAPRVLLAEDHPINRRVVELILGAAGVDLTSVENGAEAVEAASRAHFDLILMDMQMPVMDGLAAIRAIRALDGPIAETPIFTLTANALPEHKQASAAAGADGHITKPVAPALLLSVVERAAETAAARAAAACERLSASA